MQVSATPPPAAAAAAATAPIPVDDVPAPKVGDAAAAPPTQPNSRAEFPLPERTAPIAQGGAGEGWKLWNEENVTRPIVDAIDGAQKVVNAEFFGFSDSGKGAHIVDALERAAQRGVEVNVFTDSISRTALPLGSYGSMKDRIEAAGGAVHDNFRLPLVKSQKDNPGRQHVDHRKVVTVDGTTAFVGGINFIKVEDDYHDAMVQLSGVDAARLAANELDRWQRVGGTVTDKHVQSVKDALKGAALVPDDPTQMKVVMNAPEQQKYELSDTYRDLIRGAKQRLWISSPGYSDQSLMEEINAAAARGVDVKLIGPGKPPLGIPLIMWVGRSHLREAVRNGATAYEIPAILHRKALIADDQVVFSSFNVTGRSKTHDHEIGVQTKDPAFVQAVQDMLQADMDKAATLDGNASGGVGGKFGDLIAQKWKVNY
jgi:cardiolipin synthase